MELSLRQETESRIHALAAETGRPAHDLVEDALAGYLHELEQTRAMLDSRFDDLKSGRVKPIDGDEAFSSLRRKSAELRSRRS